MFNLLKKKETEPTVLAPCDGRIIPLEQVQDATFSQKMMGDGFAVMPAGEYIVAPFKGTVLMVFLTLHAIGLRAEDGLEFLIHIGMDTVNEKGKGFECFVREGDKIKPGTTLIHFDREALQAKGYDMTIPCVITNGTEFSITRLITAENAKAGKTSVLTYSQNRG